MFSCGAQVLRCLCIFSAHIYFFNCFNVWHQGWVLSCRQGATPRLTPVLGIWNLCGWTNHHMLHGFFLTVYTLWLPADLQEAVAIGRICYHFNLCLLGSWFIWKLYWKETWSLTSFILTWWFSSSALFQNFLALKISRFPRLCLLETLVDSASIVPMWFSSAARIWTTVLGYCFFIHSCILLMLYGMWTDWYINKCIITFPNNQCS